MQFTHRTLSACFVLTLLFAIAAHAQTESTLYNFMNTTDGTEPGAPLILASDGNFYGTTFYGGTGGTDGTSNEGTVFRITPSGVLTTLYRFCSVGSCTDGVEPDAGLIEAADGNLYGTTFGGGAYGGGTVFKITSSTGAFSTVYNFCKLASCADGQYLDDAIIQGSDGNFYGTTVQGGANKLGVVFKLTPAGALTVLYNFCSLANCTDGDQPTAGLVQGSDGNFYGATGLFSSKGAGTVYQITPSGSLTTLHNFCSSANCSDGQFASSNLVQAADGNFYGTTQDGGANGYGVAFRTSSTGQFSVVHDFCAVTNCPDGRNAIGLLQATDGNLYGTGELGGTGGENGSGTIFELSTSGSFTSLYSFCNAPGCSDGADPVATLIQGADGNLYGTTEGIFDGPTNGNVFKLVPASTLSAPVQLSLTSTSIQLGSSATLAWKVPYAISTTAHLCNAFVQKGLTGAGKWTGTQSGTYSSSTNLYTGSATIAPTAAGTYTYALTCGGVESGFATLTVTSNKSASTTALTATPSSPTIGQSVTLNAQITGSGATPTGSVTFSYGSDVLHTSTINSGAATFIASTNGLPVGTYPITAKYSGDSNYNASSGTDSVILAAAPTTTTLTATPTSVTPPADVTLTATVKRSASGATGTPTGSVTFYADSTVALATVKLNSSGTATITASSNGYAANTYPISAKYLGDASDSTSTSTAVNVTVK
jgi:uncharacterized repeat protein (TIGR03803 family)